MLKKLQDPSAPCQGDRLQSSCSHLWVQRLSQIAALFAILASATVGLNAAAFAQSEEQEELHLPVEQHLEFGVLLPRNKRQNSDAHKPQWSDPHRVMAETFADPQDDLSSPAIAQAEESESEQTVPTEEQDADPPGDPELGTLRLQELEIIPLTAPVQPKLYLLGEVGYLRSNNILSGIDPVDDGLFQAGLTLLTVPYSNSQTSVFAYGGGGFIRYGEQSQFDYDRLNFGVSVRQQLFPQTYGELGWSNQQLFREDGGERFLNDHSLIAKVGRQDILAERLRLDTSYQFRLSFAEPDSRSQTIHTFSSALQYSPLTSLRLGLDYQLSLADFTQRDRFDTYHQLLARLTYIPSPKTRIELFGGRSFGSSSDSNIDFDGFIFGINFGFILY